MTLHLGPSVHLSVPALCPRCQGQAQALGLGEGGGRSGKCLGLWQLVAVWWEALEAVTEQQPLGHLNPRRCLWTCWQLWLQPAVSEEIL